ncbi:MAG: serine/threonine protein kinase, partial [Planctomycetaceae bacterium]|nr:serine/threonine protein kinase [Planctomycetaceae bacterium]
MAPRFECPDDGDLMLSFDQGHPSPDVSLHLVSCRRCRRRVVKLDTRRTSLRQLMGCSDRFQRTTSPPQDAAAISLTEPQAECGSAIRQIGKYPVLRWIAAGGQADVYLARHPGLNCEVMIKLAHQSLPADAQLASRLHQEAEILASLNHPHLARVWDADLFEGRPFLVLERINGETMLQSLRHGRPKVQEVVRRLHQLLDAVAVVHNIGVLHLDLKPENVMLASPSHVKLIDFGAAGFACDPDESGEAVSSIGTPEYMAPEQRAGLCEAISEQTDIFGLGGVLYVQLFGEPPFAHGRALPTFEMSSSPIWNSSQATEPIPGHDDQSRTRDVPQVLVEICRRALDQRLEKRYRTLSEFDAALRRFTQIERTGGYRRLLGAATLAVGLMSLAWTLAGRMSELPTDRNNHVRADVLDGGTWIPLEKAVP